MALLVVAIDVFLAQRIGIIRDGMPYDGVGYAVDAKALHRALLSRGWHALVEHGFSLTFAPMWKLLMVLNFEVFGEGLWQVYAVRVWQVFAFLFMTFWISGRHGGAGFAMFMTAVAVTVPTISPNATSVLRQFITGRFDANNVYIADLRPDALYAILLVLAIALLIEGDQPTLLVMILDGAVTGAALLVKTSTAPLTLAVWGIGIAYFAWRWRRDPRLIGLIMYSVAAFVAVMMPWALLGGIRTTLEYLTSSALGTSGVFLYGIRDANLAQVVSYYWDWYRYHIGAGCIAGLVLAAVVHLVRPRTLVTTSSWSNVAVYGCLALMLYLIVTAETVKNYFLGLPAYFLGWILLLILGAGVWRLLISRLRRVSLAWGGTALSLAAIILAYSSRLPQASVVPSYRSNLLLVQSLAVDMRRLLSNNDSYLTYWTSEFPGIIDFFLIDERGNRPHDSLFRASATGFLMDPDPIHRREFVRSALAPASAIVMFDDSIQVAEHSVYVPRGGRFVLRTIREYVSDPAHGMCKYRRYRFERLRGFDSNGGLTAVLYARCDRLYR